MQVRIDPDTAKRWVEYYDIDLKVQWENRDKKEITFLTNLFTDCPDLNKTWEKIKDWENWEELEF